MSAKMHIILEGLPEHVQETADVLDRAFPGLMTWRRFAEPGRDYSVRLEGKAAEWNGEFPASGKAWKLSPVAGRVSPQRGAFCASLSKSLLP